MPKLKSAEESGVKIKEKDAAHPTVPLLKPPAQRMVHALKSAAKDAEHGANVQAVDEVEHTSVYIADQSVRTVRKNAAKLANRTVIQAKSAENEYANTDNETDYHTEAAPKNAVKYRPTQVISRTDTAVTLKQDVSVQPKPEEKPLHAQTAPSADTPLTQGQQRMKEQTITKQKTKKQREVQQRRAEADAEHEVRIESGIRYREPLTDTPKLKSESLADRSVSVLTAKEKSRNIRSVEKNVPTKSIHKQTLQIGTKCGGAEMEKLQAVQKQVEQKNKKAAKRLAETVRKLAEAAKKATEKVVKSLVGMGAAGAAMLCLFGIVLVASLVLSPMGIVLTDEANNGATLTEAVTQISTEYSARLRGIRSGYDRVSMVGHAPSWRDVIAVYACKVAGSDDGSDVITLDDAHITRMKEVFWDMTEISSESSTVVHEDFDPEDEVDDSWTETVVTITVIAKTAEDMRLIYNFSPYQNSALDALLIELEDWNLFATDLDISDATAIYCWENLPADLSPERRLVVEYALSLAGGKVHYFWGGKSLCLGNDPRWGQSMLVWAAGSSTSGTYRPYGMDCSGFVDWAFYNASDGSYVIGQGGGCIAQHYNCYSISWSDALPGDLVFYPGDSHIGIFVGRDSSGYPLICHCASGGQNGVYVTGQVGFTSIARPYYYSD